MKFLTDGDITKDNNIGITTKGIDRKRFFYKDDYNQDLELQSVLAPLTDPTFGATCDNFVLAYVLNVYYEADKTKDFASFKLTKAELKLTFGI
jgi:hypothetical protein